MEAQPNIRGRGALENPANRFDRLHVAVEVDIVADGVEQEVLLALAERLVIRLPCIDSSRSGWAKPPSGLSAAEWMRIREVFVWVSMSSDLAPSSMTIETHPPGEMTSFTKKAVSDIIGPQPASYQPTEPSSNSTCRWP